MDGSLIWFGALAGPIIHTTTHTHTQQYQTIQGKEMIRLVADAGASGRDFGALMAELVREGELNLLDAGAVDEVVACGWPLVFWDWCRAGALGACDT